MGQNTEQKNPEMEMTQRTPLEPHKSRLLPGDRKSRGRHAGRYAVLLPIVFIGFFLALKKAFGEADMPGAQMLRMVVFIPLMSALLTGCIPLIAGVFSAQTWGRRIAKVAAVLLLLALTLPLAFCSLAFDVRFT